MPPATLMTQVQITKLQYGNFEITDLRTKQLIAACIANFIDLHVSNMTMGANPPPAVPGEVKYARVEYVHNDLAKVRNAVEATYFLFSYDIRDVTYGVDRERVKEGFGRVGKPYYKNKPLLMEPLFDSLDTTRKFSQINYPLLASASDDPAPGEEKKLDVWWVWHINPGRHYVELGHSPDDWIEYHAEVRTSSTGAALPQ